MIKIKLSELDAPVKMERNCIARMKDFIEDERWHSERLLVLYGLPETGKDMLAKQILSYYRNSVKCSVYEVEETDTMEDIYQLLERIQEQDKDRVRQIIWFREITRVKDFIRSSACLPDIFATYFRVIIVSGTDSFTFYNAGNDELFDRTTDIHTTYISFTEHCRLLGSKSLDDYIHYGGLLNPSGERVVHDYDSAYQYVDKYIAENIYRSTRSGCRFDRYEPLKGLPLSDLKMFVHGILSICSGVFAKDKAQALLKKVAEDENRPVHEILDFIEDGFFSGLDAGWSSREVSEEFLAAISVIAGNRKLRLEPDMACCFDEVLRRMDVVSVFRQVNFIFEDGSWKIKRRTYPYHVIQPAVRYWYLQEGREFIEDYRYYNEISEDGRKTISRALGAKIDRLMVAETVLHDVGCILSTVFRKNWLGRDKRFEVFRAEFRKDGCLYGSYDLVVGDWETLSHWGFVINNGFEPSSEDDRLFSDRELQEKLQKQFGRCNNVAVLYKGKSSISRFGTVYLNIYDFLSSLESNRDMGKVFKELLEGISKLDK